MATYTHLLLRPGELFLKGKNQRQFVQQLCRNIEAIAGQEPSWGRGRLLLPFFPEHAMLQRIFGITSYSPALRTEKSLKALQQGAVQFLTGRTGTFRIEAKRSDKSFPLSSREIKREVGRHVEKEMALSCSLENPDFILQVEVNQDGAFLFEEKIPCRGGLPVGVGGKVLVLLEDEASILAGLLMLKRGCSIVPVSFEEKDISLLQEFCPKKLAMRRIKEREEIGKLMGGEGAGVLVTGERMETMKAWKGITVFRPLVAYAEEEVKGELKRYRKIVGE